MNIALKISRAITYLHSTNPIKPIIHRNIKSANILVDSKNNPKLSIDDLCNRVTLNMSHTITTVNPYMAPEGVRGDVSEKLDTFSFGVVIMEIITGLLPLDTTRSRFDIVSTYAIYEFQITLI